MMRGHPTGIEILAFLDNELPPNEAAEVGEHCQICEECRSELESMRLLVGQLAADVQAEEPHDPVWAAVRQGVPERATPMFAMGTVAACLLGVVIGVWAGAGGDVGTSSSTQVAGSSVDYLWPEDGSNSFLQSMVGGEEE